MTIFKRNGEKLEYDQSQDLFLEKLYGSLAGRCLLKVLTQPVITELGGAFMNSPLSKGQIKSFVEKNHIDLNLYEYVVKYMDSSNADIGMVSMKRIIIHTMISLHVLLKMV